MRRRAKMQGGLGGIDWRMLADVAFDREFTQFSGWDANSRKLPTLDICE
jgi:hypothetical protein